MARLKRKGEDWRRKLPRPIRFRDGRILAILGDCRDYVLALPDGESGQDKWQHAAKLMFDAAKGGSLIEVVDQFERILIHQNKIKLE
jgi:hypothetical protein